MREILEARFPAGVRLARLQRRPDGRGAFTEFFREEWDDRLRPVQWNLVSSDPNVLRGVHVHIRHWDYLLLASGRASIALRDLRRGSPTEGLSTVVALGNDSPAALTIPPGVAHGFYFHEPSIHIYGVSEYWNSDDELGCHWSDPALGLPWTIAEPLLSERDRSAGTLALLLETLEPHQPIGAT